MSRFMWRVAARDPGVSEHHRGVGFVRGALTWAFDCGLTKRAANLWNTNSLWVLCYHRVADPDAPRFSGLRSNVSATPDQFELQVDYLAKNFDPIGIADLCNALKGRHQLPRRPVLVTFDDGYKDNAEVAWPILKAHGVPAVVFLATDHVGTGRPFLWDLAAYCFRHAATSSAEVPLLGAVSIASERDRFDAADRWVARSKLCPSSGRGIMAEALQRSLAVAVPEDAFDGLYLSWADVRRLQAEGFAAGGHTKTHPILTSISFDQARDEIRGCYRRIAAELGRPPLAFAYPNGSKQDFNIDHEAAVRQGGYALSFSLEPGPASLDTVRRRPMAIRRIFVGLRDDLPRFAAKLAGAWRLGASVSSLNRARERDSRC